MLQRDAIILIDSNPLYCDILILQKFVTVKHNEVLKVLSKLIYGCNIFDDIIKIVFLCFIIIYMRLLICDVIYFPLFSD